MGNLRGMYAMVTKEFEITLINIILVEVLHSASSVKTEMSSIGQTHESCKLYLIWVDQSFLIPSSFLLLSAIYAEAKCNFSVQFVVADVIVFTNTIILLLYSIFQHNRLDLYHHRSNLTIFNPTLMPVSCWLFTMLPRCQRESPRPDPDMKMDPVFLAGKIF